MGESAEPYREFIREMTVRMERVLREFVRESREERRVVLAAIEKRGEEHRRMFAELDDLREESRAQTKALLAMIDRLEGGGAAPAT